MQQFETIVENADKIHISDSKLNVLCRTIADNIIKYKQSLSPEELDAWNKKAEEINLNGRKNTKRRSKEKGNVF